jgi:TPP-dependent pyruvate/acetoin dehydrogenase alpha subunit
MTGHSAHDAAHYVPQGLFDEWGKLDPITRLEARMLAEGWADQTRSTSCAPPSTRSGRGVAWAEQSPFPDPATLLDDVYESL